MNIALRKWQSAFINGAYDSYDRYIQIRAGWYDWFCKDKSLRNKTYKMGDIISKIAHKGKVNLDTQYVFFKNNCPVNGPLYDDFRICDLDTGNVKLTVQIDCCWSDSKYTVYGIKPDGSKHWDEPLFKTKSKRELIKWLNTPWEE